MRITWISLLIDIFCTNQNIQTKKKQKNQLILYLNLTV